MTTALETIREDQALGAAWRRCEAALPEGWRPVEVVPLETSAHHWDEYEAAAVSWEWWTTDTEEEDQRAVGSGPTPTAALLALAERLEAGNG